MRHQWWNTSEAAWGVLVLGIGAGVVLTYLSPGVGITVGTILSLLGIWLIIRAYRHKKDSKKSLTYLTSEVYSKISMACHLWKCEWQLYPEHLEGAQGNGGKYLDVWDWMKEKNILIQKQIG